MKDKNGRDVEGLQQIAETRGDRHWNRGVSLCAVAAATVALAMTLRRDLRAEDPPRPDAREVVRARKIELIDAAGIIRCSMEVEDEFGRIVFMGSDGSTRLAIGITGDESSPYLRMWGEPGKYKVLLDANPQAGFSLFGDSGRPLLRAVVQKNQEVQLETLNPDGEVVWRAKE